MKIAALILLVSVMAQIVVVEEVMAQEIKPKTQWELGMGVGHLTSSAYIGSSEQVSLTTPVPFIKVKTDWFDLNEGSLKMKWFEGTPFRLSFNFDLGLPVDSSEVTLRQGMPDLKLILQAGPLFSYQLKPTAKINWKIELPLLFALSVDGADSETQGWTATPRIVMRLQLNEQASPLDLEMSIGPVYGAKKFHQYYYSVTPNDVTADRAEYDADVGYAGWRLNTSFTKRVDNLWFGLYLRYHNLSGAVFDASPLVDQKDYWLVTFAMSYIFESNL